MVCLKLNENWLDQKSMLFWNNTIMPFLLLHDFPMKVKIHFYRGTHFISYLIRLRTFSEFSHVSIQIDDKIYESKEGEWVVATVAKANPPLSLVKTFEFNVPKKKLIEWEKWLKSQLWHKYDYMSILLFAGLPRKYKPDKKWICSEYAAWFCAKVGILKRKPKKLLSPEALMLVLSGWQKHSI